MPKGVYAAASAMVMESRALEVTARNLAHAQTPGYRTEGSLRIPFSEVLKAEGRQEDASGDGGTGVLPAGSYFSFEDGAREPTEAPYDLALSGDGFFTVQDPKGRSWLTRGGHFQLDAQNRLATSDGYLLQGQGGPITVPAEAERLVVDESGYVWMERSEAGKVSRSVVDQLRIATVDKPRQMGAMNGVYFAANGQPLRDSKATVHQGELERGNVNPIDELVRMVTLQRRFETAQKALSEQARAGEGYSDILRG